MKEDVVDVVVVAALSGGRDEVGAEEGAEEEEEDARVASKEAKVRGVVESSRLGRFAGLGCRLASESAVVRSEFIVGEVQEEARAERRGSKTKDETEGNCKCLCAVY